MKQPSEMSKAELLAMISNQPVTQADLFANVTMEYGLSYAYTTAQRNAKNATPPKASDDMTARCIAFHAVIRDTGTAEQNALLDTACGFSAKL